MSKKIKIYRSENVNRENSDKINDNMWHAFKTLIHLLGFPLKPYKIVTGDFQIQALPYILMI